MLKLRLRLCRSSNCIETDSIVDTSFQSSDPEIIISYDMAKRLFEEEIHTVIVERNILGRRVIMPRTIEMVNTYVVSEDKISGPVQAYLDIVQGEFSYVSSKLASLHRIVIIDPWEGLWCFREELGSKIRRSV